MARYFYPTIQLRPAAGARTLLHIGTHRREYRDLDPNHLCVSMDLWIVQKIEEY